MYPFKQVSAAGFNLTESIVSPGVEHKKRFIEDGVTPQTQETFNVYTKGSFSFEVPEIGFSKTLTAGQTSYDLDVTYPKDAVCVEKPLEEGSIRVCISSAKPKDTLNREVLAINASQTTEVAKNSLVFVISGTVAISGTDFVHNSFVVTEDTRTILAKTDSKIAVFKCKTLAE